MSIQGGSLTVSGRIAVGNQQTSGRGGALRVLSRVNPTRATSCREGSARNNSRAVRTAIAAWRRATIRTAPAPARAESAYD